MKKIRLQNPKGLDWQCPNATYEVDYWEMSISRVVCISIKSFVGPQGIGAHDIANQYTQEIELKQTRMVLFIYYCSRKQFLE